ncbi:MAG: hypothetical protein ACKVH8_01310 [Pirellulales bacterium]
MRDKNVGCEDACHCVRWSNLLPADSLFYCCYNRLPTPIGI